MLSRFRELLRARRELAAADGPVEWIRSGPVIAYRRGAAVVVMNGSGDPVTLQPEGPYTTVFSTDGVHPAQDRAGVRR